MKHAHSPSAERRGLATALNPFAGERADRPSGGPGTEAVHILCATQLALVRRDGRDLTTRQLIVFMTVYLDARVHTVGSMAELLNVSRPGVTRTLDRLAEGGLLSRQEDRRDRRRVQLCRTEAGLRFLRELEDITAASQRQGTRAEAVPA